MAAHRTMTQLVHTASCKWLDSAACTPACLLPKDAAAGRETTKSVAVRRMHVVGPPLVETTAKPLLADLSAFLESGQGTPAIYVSMGASAVAKHLRAALPTCCFCDHSLFPRQVPSLWELVKCHLSGSLTTCT